MLTKYQELAFKILARFYFFMHSIPVKWNSNSQTMAVHPQKRKWVLWQISNCVVLIHLLFCAYIIVSQPFLQRKDFGVLEFCVLSKSGYVFIYGMCGSLAVYSLQNTQTLDAFNHFTRLEEEIYRSKL